LGRTAAAQTQFDLTGILPQPKPAVSAVVAGRPKFPGHLSKAARAEVKRVCKLLEQRGTLTPGDMSLLSVYGEVYARWIDAKKELNATGVMVTITCTDSNGVAFEKRVENPLLKITTACERQIFALVKTLGLSPVDKDKARKATPGIGGVVVFKPGSVGAMLHAEGKL
jgi:P27 family predicted phage terminase small subunit